MASLDGSLAEKIDFAAQQLYQFLLHSQVIEQAPVSFPRKRDQHIHITITTKIITQHGTKEGQLADMPAPTKGIDLLFSYTDICPDHCLNQVKRPWRSDAATSRARTGDLLILLLAEYG
jgi:hypothetical protein